jgi:hypothetical protein
MERSMMTIETLLLAALYIKRIRETGSYRLQLSTICILVTTTLYMGSKFLEDQVLSTHVWAAASGFRVVDIVTAERALLRTLDYRLHAALEEIHAVIAEAL